MDQLDDFRLLGSGRLPWLPGLTSQWSPDETRFAVPVPDLRNGVPDANDFRLRTYLYAVPPAWRGAAAR